MIIKKIRNFFSYGFFMALSIGFWVIVLIEEHSTTPFLYKFLNTTHTRFIIKFLEKIFWTMEDLIYPSPLYGSQKLFYQSVILVAFASIFGILGWIIQIVVRKYKIKLGKTIRQKTWKLNSIVASVVALSYLAAMTSYAGGGGWISFGFTFEYGMVLILYGIPSVIFIFILNYIIHKVKNPFKGVVIGFALSIPFFIIATNSWINGHYNDAQSSIIRGVVIIIGVTIYAYYMKKKKNKNDV